MSEERRTNQRTLHDRMANSIVRHILRRPAVYQSAGGALAVR
jgi:hypothetical protein